ncbi:transglycosylase domain-containing protein [Isoptericola sp. S6320L]|uniref:transglycosylase domain-containing protein n=1 Tax=Isoptericola sp. S6320L TaxID=2926411 RepID=UPI001FF19183|nr:transglycosylase domain-containing protein [Isoptericola sp. S6320L]MCK0116004.1 transglycosylase domain-containing protein [Isoptericola sp. S6320L]
MASKRRRRFWNYPRRGKNPVQRWLPSWRVVVGCMLGCLALGAGVFFAAWTSTEIPENLDDVNHQATTVYYGNGKEVGSYSTITREIVDYETLPSYVGDAVVASENASFWTDPGVDMKGMARALWTNLTSDGGTQGGSTLTQQYVERYYLGSTTDVLGKAQEAIIALKITREQSKELVLDRYLNTIYFGRGAYGVQAAAQAYFGKDAADLTYSESAMLAGIIPSPVNYDPSVQLEVTQKRWERSINRMADQGYITEEERQSAEFPEFKEKEEGGNSLGGQKGYIMAAVKAELLKNGLTEEEIETKGLQIYTTIKPKLQREAAKIVKNMPDDASKKVRASIVSIDPSNGAVVTLYGGKDYIKQALNTASQDRIQGGSTFKPFTLIGALEEGHELNETFDGNSPGHLDPEDPSREWPTNFGLQSYGQIDLVKATANSVNTAYVALNIEVGPEKTADVAHRLGIREETEIDPYPSNVLGTADVYPVDLASAYATIAAGGNYIKPHVVERVEHRDGSLRWEPETTPDQRFERDVITQATYAMTQVVEQGSGRAALELTGPDGTRRPVAGKTGTSNDNVTAWFAGFTPQLATVVNVRQYKKVDVEEGILADRESIDAFGGYDEITGSTWPASAWTDYMQVALDGKEIQEFPAYTPPRPSFSPSPTPSESTPEWVELPGNLVGMDISQATTLLQEMGLKVATQAANDQAAKGTVISVNSGGGKIPAGSTITLVVSTGQPAEPQQVAVPNVAGQPRTAAEQQLRRVGLSAATAEEFSNDVPVGNVIRTDPGAGAEVAPDSTVTIVVSRGPEQTEEPEPEPEPTDEEGGGGGNGGGGGGGGNDGGLLGNASDG